MLARLRIIISLGAFYVALSASRSASTSAANSDRSATAAEKSAAIAERSATASEQSASNSGRSATAAEKSADASTSSARTSQAALAFQRSQLDKEIRVTCARQEKTEPTLVALLSNVGSPVTLLGFSIEKADSTDEHLVYMSLPVVKFQSKFRRLERDDSMMLTLDYNSLGVAPPPESVRGLIFYFTHSLFLRVETEEVRAFLKDLYAAHHGSPPTPEQEHVTTKQATSKPMSFE